MGGGPKEDPADKAARLRDRRMATLERSRASERNASGLTRDLGSTYSLRSLSMFGQSGSGNGGGPPRRMGFFGPMA